MCDDASLCLGIESTSHTFGAAVVEKSELAGSFRILADVKEVYRPELGSGIHPREASRHHVETCSTVLANALKKAKVRTKEIDLIAYSAGPGLGPCLRVGAVVARTLASYYKKPIVPTNHAIGHIELGKVLCKLEDPMALVVTGGHTALAALVGRDWRIFGETLDLTLGQLIDQIGRFIGLASPAGPQIEILARRANERSDNALLSLPYIIKGNDVSYSGLLSAAKELISAKRATNEAVCFALQEVAFSILTEATERALAFSGKNELLVTGGVAANRRLKTILELMCKSRSVKVGVIPMRFAGDCGAQIAVAGFSFYNSQLEVEPRECFIRQSWRIDQVSL